MLYNAFSSSASLYSGRLTSTWVPVPRLLLIRSPYSPLNILILRFTFSIPIPAFSSPGFSFSPEIGWDRR